MDESSIGAVYEIFEEEKYLKCKNAKCILIPIKDFIYHKYIRLTDLLTDKVIQIGTPHWDVFYSLCFYTYVKVLKGHHYHSLFAHVFCTRDRIYALFNVLANTSM